MRRLRVTVGAAALLLALPLSVAAAVPALAVLSPAGSAAPATAPATAPASVPALGAAATGDPAAVRIELPRPTGPYGVGREILHLVDRDRPDPWVPSAGPRQLMVSMYYPAHAARAAWPCT